MVQWIRSLSLKLQNTWKKEIQNTILGFKSSQCQSINSHMELFFYLNTVSYKAITLLRDTLTYFNSFLSMIPCRYSVVSFQIKKTEEFSGYIHEYLAKVKSITLLQMHDLLEILEHTFCLLVGFSSIHKTTCYITIWAKLVCSNNRFHCN